DSANPVWVIPAHRSKSGAPQEVPLSDLAVDLLKSLPRFAGDYVLYGRKARRPRALGLQAAQHHRAAASQRRRHQGGEGGVMGEKYFAELERIWQQNRGSQVRKCSDLEFFGCPRPKALRGPDLVQELVGLAALTEDTRFKDAIFALIEHRI